MPWYIYSLARGSVFYWGAVGFVLAVFLRSSRASRTRRIAFVVLLVLSAGLIAISAAAIPYWLYFIWAAGAIAWLPVSASRWPRVAMALKTAMVLVAGLASATELSYALRPSVAAGSFHRVYVVGDSISAGIGAEHGKTWPVILASEHRVKFVDVSHPGATIAEADKRVKKTPPTDAIVVIEIGGNDLLSHVNPAQFASDLRALVDDLQGPGRTLVMLELPLLPFENSYGLAQRRIARRFHITLIPRRLFVDILQTPGATVDGIHLSATGQRMLADMIWGFIGPSMGG